MKRRINEFGIKLYSDLFKLYLQEVKHNYKERKRGLNSWVKRNFGFDLFEELQSYVYYEETTPTRTN